MKLSITTTVLFAVLLWSACKTQKKTTNAVNAEVIAPVIAHDIELYNKPLDVIIKHTAVQRWKLVYSTGGMTGKDLNKFDDTYYTLANNGTMITEAGGEISEAPYKWLKARDIFTGDSTYVISGIVQWKVEGIYHDTLRLSDNFVDGYHYALIRAK